MFATKTGASFRTMSVASSRRGSSMQRVIISLALATLAACKPPAADEAMARTMVTHALIGPSAPLASPDSEGAVWSASKVPGRILYGQPGAAPLLALECEGTGKEALVRISRIAPADEDRKSTRLNSSH